MSQSQTADCTLRRLHMLLPLLATGLMPAQAATPLAGDVATTLSVAPSAYIEPYQLLTFTWTITNNGPAPIPSVILWGPRIYNEFYLPATVEWSDCGLTIAQADSQPPIWRFSWFVAGLPLNRPLLLVGETRTCHFRLTASPNALPRFPFTVSLPFVYSDANPTNNAATVILAAAAKPVPLLAWPLLSVPAASIGLLGLWALKPADNSELRVIG
ncbi:hypothetical protein [Tahibacter harae]|uniref:DUF11 domain-containing protein n=1 Tax=Tahibacter harae TaxID=2963937 RepID=A0ABT1QPX9_9GAMM|nr:hypothetical protein [Tahibacter harae]MCQ4164327.1 hypothetical protein [Tahibacter harae]